MAVGVAAALYYARAGLTTSHYDARAHLVVARRILDSLTPGWQQIGAVWLPLPHVLNMLPVQVDAWYRTGASAVAISVLSMTAASWAVASVILRTTGSMAGAITSAALMMANPNVLYLQSTPMTEPLLFGTTMLAIGLTAAWLERGDEAVPRAAGIALAAACLTRYEAWPVTAATLGLATVVMLRQGVPWRIAARRTMRLAAYPVIAILMFMTNSRYTVGAWFVSDGFFVPENIEALGRPLVALDQVREGLYRLSGSALVWSAYAGAVAVLVAFLRSRKQAPLVLLAALTAAGALPIAAYVNGHPFRIRYDLPLVVACATLSGAFVATLWRPLGWLAGVLIVATSLNQAHPLDAKAPLIIESQRDASNMAGRRTVTAYLSAHHDGRPILMSMGSLGHYMHDLSKAGFDIHDFIHEGNDRAWPYALLRARWVAGWVVIEERAEGGDALFRQAKQNHRFLEGFDRVAEGGNVALYRARRE